MYLCLRSRSGCTKLELPQTRKTAIGGIAVTDKLHERAWQWWWDWIGPVFPKFDKIDPDSGAGPALIKLLERTRAETIEECAALAYKTKAPEPFCEHDQFCYCATGKIWPSEIADEIRKLAERKTK